MNKLWNYLAGYVIIEVEGLFIENFLTRAQGMGVVLAQTKRVCYTMVRARVSYPSYLKIRKLAELCKVEIRVKRRGGVLSPLDMAKRHLIICAGIVAVAIFIIATSSLVLDISIEGNDKVSTFDIMGSINEMGVHKYMPKASVDFQALEDHLRALPPIMHVSTYFKGGRLVIRIVEGKGQERPPQTAKYLVASKAALVEKVTALSGKAMVNAGDIVNIGDILISGEYLSKEKLMQKLAQGSVLARVTYTGRAIVDMDTSVLRGTGEKVQVRYIKLGNTLVPLSGQIPFEQFVVTDRKDVLAGENSVLPLHVITAKVQKAQKVKSDKKLEVARLYAREKAYYAAAKDIDETAQICSLDVKISEKSGKIYAVATIQTLEDIVQPANELNY